MYRLSTRLAREPPQRHAAAQSESTHGDISKKDDGVGGRMGEGRQGRIHIGGLIEWHWFSLSHTRTHSAEDVEDGGARVCAVLYRPPTRLSYRLSEVRRASIAFHIAPIDKHSCYLDIYYRLRVHRKDRVMKC